MSADRTAVPAACVLVCGGDRADRARRIAELVERHQVPAALVLTSSPAFFRAALPQSVEIRDDDPAALGVAYRERLACAAGRGPGLLLADPRGSLARSLSWEYLRRAVESAAWPLVVRELDGTFAALAELAIAREAADLVEQYWPRNTRYAALAAGDNLDPALRDAHEIAGTLEIVCGWLSGALASHDPADERPSHLEVEIVAGADSDLAAVVSGLLGADSPGAVPVRPPERIEPVDGLPAYVLDVAVPAEPDAMPDVIDGELRVRFGGVPVSVPLGGVLARCTVRECRYLAREKGGPRLELTFVANPHLWPESLISAHRARTGK